MSKIVCFVICFVLGIFSGTSQRSNTKIQDLPPNPQAGYCYLRCYTDDGEKADWKAIDCILIEYQKLDVLSGAELSRKDKKTLDKIFKRFVKKGYTLQLDSYYTSSKAVGDNVIISRERAIIVGNYLIAKGLSPENLKVNALGPTQKKTGFRYRAIHGSSAKWKYLEKEGIWCKITEA